MEQAVNIRCQQVHVVLVEHHALEACVRAHVDTHLFVQPAGVAVGDEGKEADPEIRPAIGLASEEVGYQFADG
jgi:hypothetical protein